MAVMAKEKKMSQKGYTSVSPVTNFMDHSKSDYARKIRMIKLQIAKKL